MIHQTEIKFIFNKGWGDFGILWLIKYELGKAFNGYLERGELKWEEVTTKKELNATELLIPFMRLPYHFPIQEMVDALTDTKKATEQIETTSELRATRYHLEDLRKLIFKSIEDKEKND